MEKILGLWGEKAFGKHMKDAKMTYPDTTFSQEWFGIFRKDNEIDEYVGKHVEGNYDMDGPDQKIGRSYLLNAYKLIQIFLF